MTYTRKTKDVYVIETNWGYGWEEESSYDHTDYDNPLKAACEDELEYMLAGAATRIVKRRVKYDM